MAVKPISATGMLARVSGTFLSGNADFTYMYWSIPVDGTPTGSTYRTFHFLTDPSSDNYIGEFSDFLSNNLRTEGAIATVPYSGAYSLLLLENAYHICVRYDNTAKTLERLINGTLVDTQSSIDFSAVTFTVETLFYDSNAAGAFPGLVEQNYRAFQRKLTDAQITKQMAHNTASDAGFTTDLFCDTPLPFDSDPNDVSGNSRNWAFVNSGVESYVLYDVKFISWQTNSGATTALPIPYLPYKLIQDSDTGVANSNLWYSLFTAAADYIIGAWNYNPNHTSQLRVFSSPTSSPVYLGFGGSNVPIQFPATGATSYLFRTVRVGPGHSTPGINLLQIDSVEPQQINIGDIVDPDDFEGLPVGIIGGSNTLTFRKPFANGEQGDILVTGVMLMHDNFGTDQPLHLYDFEFNEILIITSLPAGDKYIRTNNGLNLFYVVSSVISGSILYTIDSDGNIGSTTWNLGAIKIGDYAENGGIASNNDGTILYYTTVAGNFAVQRWDLTNDVALTDFLPLVSGYSIIDMLIDTDDSIIIGYYETSSGHDFFVRRYDDGGNLLNTYNFGDTHSTISPRLAYSINNPDSFWIWLHAISNEDPRTFFKEIDVTTGSVLETRESVEFELGTYDGEITPTPYARYGVSQSCPFWQFNAGEEPPPPPPPTNPLSGIYVLELNKRNDTVYITLDPVTSEDVKIPDPTYKTGFVG